MYHKFTVILIGYLLPQKGVLKSVIRKLEKQGGEVALKAFAASLADVATMSKEQRKTALAA